MDTWNFGLTMTVVGTAGTFITLGIIILAIAIFKKIFPVQSETKPAEK